jgi:general stress protein 26
MFVKITGYNGTKKKSYFVLVEGTLEENKLKLDLNTMNLFATSCEPYEEASKDDPDFIAYIKSDILEVEKEIAKKQKLLEELKAAL